LRRDAEADAGAEKQRQKYTGQRNTEAEKILASLRKINAEDIGK